MNWKYLAVWRSLLAATFLSVALPALADVIPLEQGRLDEDGETVWYDAMLLGVEGRGWTETESYYDRLPVAAEKTVTGAVWNLSHHTAGLFVPFTTDAHSIQVRWTLRNPELAMPHMPATGVSGLDLYEKHGNRGWRYVANGRPTKQSNVATLEIVNGRQYRLYLPLYNGVTSVEFGVPRENTLSSLPRDERKPIVFYGTSITQGACASRPGMAATAIVGRKLDWPVINLGFSGSGKMEPAMADLLAELDATVYVLDCLWNMKPRLIEERAEPFVRRLRAARPETPILLVEDSYFYTVSRATWRTDRGHALRAAFDRLKAEGVENLSFLWNEGMLGYDCEGTVDGVHPNDLGMMRQADVFVEALRPFLPETKRAVVERLTEKDRVGISIKGPFKEHGYIDLEDVDVPKECGAFQPLDLRLDSTRSTEDLATVGFTFRGNEDPSRVLTVELVARNRGGSEIARATATLSDPRIEAKKPPRVRVGSYPSIVPPFDAITLHLPKGAVLSDIGSFNFCVKEGRREPTDTP